MPELVDRQALNRARFPRCPLSARRFAALCRCGDMPGAVQLGGRWMVDLEAFDAALLVAQRAPAAPARGSTVVDFQSRVREARARHAAEASSRG